MRVIYLHHNEDALTFAYYHALSDALESAVGAVSRVNVAHLLARWRVPYHDADLVVLGKSIPERFPTVPGLRSWRGPKLAFLTNEHADMIPKLTYLENANCGWIASQYPAERVSALYGRHTRAQIVTFTHGVTPELERLAPRPWAERRFDLSFRGVRYPYSLGHADRERIAAHLAGVASSRSDLRISLPTPGEGVLPGPRYLELLQDSRAVLGSEMGGEFIELDDRLRLAVGRLLSERERRGLPTTWADAQRSFGSRFTELRRTYPSGRGVSSRIFEAAMAGCLQILLEGDYQGLFVPGEHYVSLKRDMSNWDDALAVLADERASAEIIARMRQRCLESHRLVDQVRALVARIIPAPR